VLDPSRQAHAHADRRLRSEQGPFARTYSAAIRVRPTRARVW
jgi:hypothetical protein